MQWNRGQASCRKLWLLSLQMLSEPGSGRKETNDRQERGRCSEDTVLQVLWHSGGACALVGHCQGATLPGIDSTMHLSGSLYLPRFHSWTNQSLHWSNQVMCKVSGAHQRQCQCLGRDTGFIQKITLTSVQIVRLLRESRCSEKPHKGFQLSSQEWVIRGVNQGANKTDICSKLHPCLSVGSGHLLCLDLSLTLHT
jgi:hypothetical protein